MRSSVTNFGPRVRPSWTAMPTVAAAMATSAAMNVSILRPLRWARMVPFLAASPAAPRSALADEAIHGAVERGGVELAVRRLAEGAQVTYPQAGATVPAGAAWARDQGSDLAGAEVPVDVAVEERAKLRVADDVAADQRALRSGEAEDLDRPHRAARGRRMGSRIRREPLEVV